MKSHTYIKITFRKAKTFLILSLTVFGSIGCFMYITIMLNRDETFIKHNIVYNFSIIAALLFSMLSVSLLSRLLDNTRGLTITDEGVFYKFYRKYTHFVWWHEIIDIKEEKTGSSTFLYLIIKKIEPNGTLENQYTVSIIEVMLSELNCHHKQLKAYIENKIIENRDYSTISKHDK